MINQEEIEAILQQTKQDMLLGIDAESVADGYVISLHDMFGVIAKSSAGVKPLKLDDISPLAVSVELEEQDVARIKAWASAPASKDQTDIGYFDCVNKATVKWDGNRISFEVDPSKFINYLRTKKAHGTSNHIINQLAELTLQQLTAEDLASVATATNVYGSYYEHVKVINPQVETPNVLLANIAFVECYSRFRQPYLDLMSKIATIQRESSAIAAYQDSDSSASDKAAKIKEIESRILDTALVTFMPLLEQTSEYPEYKVQTSLFGRLSRSKSTGGFAIQYTADRDAYFRQVVNMLLKYPEVTLQLITAVDYSALALKAIMDNYPAERNEQEEAFLKDLAELTGALKQLELTSADFQRAPDGAFKDTLAAAFAKTQKQIQAFAPGPVHGKRDVHGRRQLQRQSVTDAMRLARARRESDAEGLRGENEASISRVVDAVLAKNVNPPANTNYEFSNNNTLKDFHITHILRMHFGNQLHDIQATALVDAIKRAENFPRADATLAARVQFVIDICNQEAPKRNVNYQLDRIQPDSIRGLVDGVRQVLPGERRPSIS